MSRTLVIRFGSLGDLCLLGWSLARLAPTDEHLCLATKSQWAGLLELVPGIDEIEVLDDSGPGALLDLASRLRRRGFDRIVDAHNILRGHLLLALLGRRPHRRLAKDTVARLRLLQGGGANARLHLSMRERFDELFEDLPDLAPTAPPLLHLRPTNGPETILGMAPGARWDSKRWPAKRFAEFLCLFRTVEKAPVRIFLGPHEQTWFRESPLAVAAAELPDVEIIADRRLPEVARLLAKCSTLVTNDSGLLHIAEATGTPVVALFGATVREFGYFPCLEESRVLEIDLNCRPCSRNGKRSCRRHDLACLANIPAGQVAETLLSMPPWMNAEAGP